MASKYDGYWAKRMPEIIAAVQRVLASGEPVTLDIADIVSLGNRRSWQGYVHLWAHRYDADMAHAVSLAHALQKAGVDRLAPPGGLDFVITGRPDLVIQRHGHLTVHAAPADARPHPAVLEEKHLTFKKDQKGVSFEELIGPYLVGAKEITITDAYIREYRQARNLEEVVEVIARLKPDEEQVSVSLFTSRGDAKQREGQVEYLEKIVRNAALLGIRFTWAFANADTIHARHIVTDHGWKILLDKGLDTYRSYADDQLSITARLPKQRAVHAFEVTFLRYKGA